MNGSTSFRLPRLGLGCVTFGREIDEATSHRLLDHALSNGINLFDTAEAYGDGRSEEILGRWIAQGRRNSVIVQTKASLDLTPEGIRQAIDHSLNRLQLDCVDIYLLHRFDPAIPLEETLDALRAVIAQGKARAIGCSNFPLEALREAREISRRRQWPPFSVVQPIYNLACREIEGDYLEFCRAQQILVVTYSPLGAGFLTGKYSNGQMPAGSRFDVMPGHKDIYFTEERFAIADRLRILSQSVDRSISEIALAWVLHNRLVDCMLIGARQVEHIEAAMRAAAAGLPADMVEEMNSWPCGSDS